jgi:hypothetical protein
MQSLMGLAPLSWVETPKTALHRFPFTRQFLIDKTLALPSNLLLVR